jgi:hypothetical protein
MIVYADLCLWVSHVNDLLEPLVSHLVSILKLSVFLRELLDCIVREMDVLVIYILEINREL